MSDQTEVPGNTTRRTLPGVESARQDAGTAAASPVFILGTPRSGTTLLQSLLDGHRQLIVAAGESQFFTHFVRPAATAPTHRRMQLADETLLRHFLSPSEYNNRYLAHLDGQQIREVFRCRVERSPGRLGDYLEAAIGAYGEVSGQETSATRYLVDKTAHHEVHVNAIFTAWPEARCIHVIRDVRGMYAAVKRRRPRETSPSEIAFIWNRSADIASRHRVRRGPASYHVVRYEDLVGEPTAVIAAIADFLEIEAHPILLQPTKAGGVHSWGGNSAYGERFTGIDIGSLDRWRSEEGISHDLAVLEALSSARLARFGYERTSGRVHVRRAAAAGRATNAVRAQRSRLGRLRDWRVMREV